MVREQMRMNTMMRGAALTVLMLALLVATGAYAEHPDMQATIEITPAAAAVGDTVRVAANVVNQGAEYVSVTLLDGDGKPCTAFGEAGRAGIAPGTSASYSGAWTVTESDAAAGRVIYYLFTLSDGDGGKTVSTMPLSATLGKQDATAKMNVERFITPGAKVKKGEQVTLSYILKNVGNVDLYDITILDPDISPDPMILAGLKTGEDAEITYAYLADEVKTTHAELSYSYEMDGSLVQSKVIEMAPPVEITLLEP